MRVVSVEDRRRVTFQEAGACDTVVAGDASAALPEGVRLPGSSCIRAAICVGYHSQCWVPSLCWTMAPVSLVLALRPPAGWALQGMLQVTADLQ